MCCLQFLLVLVREPKLIKRTEGDMDDVGAALGVDNAMFDQFAFVLSDYGTPSCIVCGHILSNYNTND